MKSRMINWGKIIISFFARISGCSKSAENEGYWKTSTPAEQGLRQENIDKAMEYMKTSENEFHSLLIIKNGYLVTEYYGYNSLGKWYGLEPYKESPDNLRVVFSTTKSIVSALIGIAIDEGLLKVTDKVLNFFPEEKIENIDNFKKAITVEDLLTLEDGIEFSLEKDTSFEMAASKNPVAFHLNPPMVTEPGTTWNYNSASPNLLMIILDKVLKDQKVSQSALSYAKEKLFEPLHITKYSWETLNHFSDIPIGGWGLALRPRDMAKFGYLYAKKGIWEGKQLISESWIEKSTKIHAHPYWEGDYGYLWFRHKEIEGFFNSQGYGGQNIYISYEHDMVIVFTSMMAVDKADLELREIIAKYLKPAIT